MNNPTKSSKQKKKKYVVVSINDTFDSLDEAVENLKIKTPGLYNLLEVSQEYEVEYHKPTVKPKNE